MGDYSITIEHMLNLCSYGTHINIKLHDTGKIVINGVNSLANSKDKRQKAKWEAFKTAHVDYIKPTTDMADLKRHDNLIILTITASIYRFEYESAIERMEKILEKGANEE